MAATENAATGAADSRRGLTGPSPVLLEFAPEPTPQICLTFALFHKDPVEGDCLLLIHPGEVFATRQSFENN